MVHRTIAAILIVLQVTQALATHALATQHPLSVRWEGSRAAPCQRLVETFLRELRTFSNDRMVQLDVDSDHSAKSAEPELSPATRLRIRCTSGATDTLEVVDAQSSDAEEQPLLLRYLERAGGFDPMDWLSFQKRYLSQPLGAELQNAASAGSFDSSARAAADVSSPHENSILERWWFWGLIGLAAAGAYAGSQHVRSQRSINVEIH